MPKLYIFVVCEKVIMSNEGQTSLIALFNELTATIPAGGQKTSFPPDAVAAKEWVIFTSWEKKPEDEGIEYLQVAEILYPDGTQFGKTLSVAFTIPTVKTHQQGIISAHGFPIGQQGIYTIKMRLERKGETVFGPTSIRINVKHGERPISAV